MLLADNCPNRSAVLTHSALEVILEHVRTEYAEGQYPSAQELTQRVADKYYTALGEPLRAVIGAEVIDGVALELDSGFFALLRQMAGDYAEHAASLTT